MKKYELEPKEAFIFMIYMRSNHKTFTGEILQYWNEIAPQYESIIEKSDKWSSIYSKYITTGKLQF